MDVLAGAAAGAASVVVGLVSVVVAAAGLEAALVAASASVGSLVVLFFLLKMPFSLPLRLSRAPIAVGEEHESAQLLPLLTSAPDDTSSIFFGYGPLFMAQTEEDQRRQVSSSQHLEARLLPTGEVRHGLRRLAKTNG